MSDVPKFVRQRAAQHAPGDHPDANLLAAFAEGSLTKGERAQMLAHLGACAACRDVVALALPDVPVATPVPAQPARHWLQWPVLRWAGAAAAVIVVAAAVVVVKPHRTAPDNAKQTVVADAAEKAAAPNPPEASAAASAGAPVRSDQAPRKDSAPSTARKEEFKAKALKKEDAAGPHAWNDALASRDLDRRAKTNEPVQSQVPAESAQVQSQIPAAPPVAPPAAAGQVAGLAAEQSRQQQSNAPQSQAALRDEIRAGATQSRHGTEQRATQQVRPAPQQTESVEVSAAAPAAVANKAARAPMAKAMLVAGNSRWRVSAEGAVERSTDGGRTWQPIRVAEKPMTFRSVSSVDHDVWAGGAGGALYHSTDDGRTWTRVTVEAFDMVLATDIARVEFTDAQHGRVTTTTGVTWTTSDAGATWSLRAKPPL